MKHFLRSVFTGAMLLLFFGLQIRAFAQHSLVELQAGESFGLPGSAMTKSESAMEQKEDHSMLQRVPVLCYHQVRDWTGSDSRNARTYILPVSRFKEQMQWLHDMGYHVILPDQMIRYIETGARLPEKPIIITFDDGTGGQVDNALPELNKQGFKAVFFIMTIVINKKGYVSANEINELSKEGNIIGCHTWDHHSVSGYNDKDWEIQIVSAKDQLEKITGSPVNYFAYPNGKWDTVAPRRLKGYGFLAAFQLWGKGDANLPLFTINRIIVDGTWDIAHLASALKKFYH